MQGQVEALGVADDHRPIRVVAGAGRLEPEVGLVEPQATPLVANQEAEMQQGNGHGDLRVRVGSGLSAGQALDFLQAVAPGWGGGMFNCCEPLNCSDCSY